MQNRLTYSHPWNGPEAEIELAEENWLEEEGFYDWEYDTESYPSRPDYQVHIGIAAFLFILFVLARIHPLTVQSNEAQRAPAALTNSVLASHSGSIHVNSSLDEPDPYLFIAPYEKYVVTQGLHGFSYGHAAVDIAAGKGTPILSPINGVVSANYFDQYGNPTLIIENEVYRVTLLHGIYELKEGAAVAAGDPVGLESNLGYTTDMNGVRCGGSRDCGYHTHLNVFSKEQGENVNPLNLIAP